MPELNRNIVLIGFMGVGKSSIGRRLAKHLGYDFVDTDQLVVQEAGMEITDIFKADGELGFRDRESAALRSLLSKEQQVIATGGGIITRESNVPLLRELGFVVWLHAEEAVIFERVSRNQKRPLLHTADPRATIHNLLTNRLSLYEQTAHYSIDTSFLSFDGVVGLVVAETERFFACPPQT